MGRPVGAMVGCFDGPLEGLADVGVAEGRNDSVGVVVGIDDGSVELEGFSVGAVEGICDDDGVTVG